MIKILKLVQEDLIIIFSLNLEQMSQAIRNNNSLINMFLRLDKIKQKLNKKNYCSF